MLELRSLFWQYQPTCLRDGPSPRTFDSSFFPSRARVAWSAAAVGGNGAEAITRWKLTFLGEITFTKYLISSRRQERRACRRLSSHGEENALALAEILASSREDVAAPSRPKCDMRLYLFVSTSLPMNRAPRRLKQACMIHCAIFSEYTKIDVFRGGSAEKCTTYFLVRNRARCI